MVSETLTNRILHWAAAAPEDVAACGLDRESPNTIGALQQALAAPLPIGTVERIELLAKSLWYDLLRPGGPIGGADALKCNEFFSRLGFFYKYKPYGVKIASPFGYSLFDLKDGEGFSFQIHTEPKLEGFHILAPKRQSLLYISSRDEWAQAGADWARRMSYRASGEDPPFVLRPQPGDVLEIAETEVVHTALGCLLEEYASCSVDAVERLFDQNLRSESTLPAQNPDVARLLRQGRGGQPLRRLERVPTGWHTEDVPADQPIIAVKDSLWGGRLALRTDRVSPIEASDELLTLVIAVDDAIEVDVEGHRMSVSAGSFACVLPGLQASVAATRNDCSVAIHRVSRELVQTDWTR